MTTRSSRHQSSPEDLHFVARTWVVSWLRAASLAFPTNRLVSGLLERAYCPLQWRGRTGITPVSVSRVRSQHFDCVRESTPVVAPRQARRLTAA